MAAGSDRRRSLADWLPGQRVIVKYDVEGEPWHERVLVFPFDLGSAQWYVATPDDDMYVEQIQGGEDIVGYRTLNAQGRYILTEQIYRFTDGLDDRGVRQLIKMGQEQAAAENATPYTLFDYKDWAGNVLSWDRRRVTGKQASGVSSSLVHVDDGGEGTPRLEGVRATGDESGHLGNRGRLVPDRARVQGHEPTCWMVSQCQDAVEVGTIVDMRDSKWDGWIVLFRDQHTLIMQPDAVSVAQRMIAVPCEPSKASIVKSSLAEQYKSAIKSLSTDDEDDIDARLMGIQYDEQGERYRPWRSVVANQQENFYEDWPAEGPRTVLWLTKHIDRNGGSPMTWFTKFIGECRLSPHDRTAYELQALARILEYAGCYDQLNLSSLVCFELLARRLQLLVDAVTRDPSNPKFDDEDLWSGLMQRASGISPAITSHVATRTKERYEVEKQREKAAELRKASNKKLPKKKGEEG